MMFPSTHLGVCWEDIGAKKNNLIQIECFPVLRKDQHGPELAGNVPHETGVLRECLEQINKIAILLQRHQFCRTIRQSICV